MADHIADIIEIVTELEKIKGYYDDAGLDMHIAVVALAPNNTHVVVSTKHWFRVHYINVEKSASDCWDILFKISKRIGRTLIKSKKGKYVYVNKMNLEQTQSVFDILKEEFGNNISRVWEPSWDIDDSVLPEELKTF
jgi:hypothetical protein